MLNRIRQLNPGASLIQVLYYAFLWVLTASMLRIFWGYRAFGSRHIPDSGPAILLCNHQSFLDPVLAGATTWRQPVYIARIGLFNNAVLRWIIESLNALPISGKQSDSAVFRKCEEFLSQGKVVMIFPEGTRSPDGAMRPLRAGVLLLIRRSKAPVIPVAIEGSYDNWPRNDTYPRRRGPIHVHVGEAISAETIISKKPADALAFMGEQLDAMRLRARRGMRRETEGRFPPPGPGDAMMTTTASSSTSA